MTIYNVYKTNNWHEFSSREFCGCFDDLDAAVAHVSSYMIGNGADEYDYTEGWAVQYLYDNLQTQDESLDEQFDIDAVTLNEWAA